MKNKLFGYLFLILCALALLVEGAVSSSVFASVPQKKAPLEKHVATGKKAVVRTKKNVAKNKPEQGSGNADLQKFESRLRQLAEKGTITQDQADNLIQSLRDIMGRMEEAFKKGSSGASSKIP